MLKKCEAYWNPAQISRSRQNRSFLKMVCVKTPNNLSLCNQALNRFLGKLLFGIVATFNLRKYSNFYFS